MTSFLARVRANLSVLAFGATMGALVVGAAVFAAGATETDAGGDAPPAEVSPPGNSAFRYVTGSPVPAGDPFESTYAVAAKWSIRSGTDRDARYIVPCRTGEVALGG